MSMYVCVDITCAVWTTEIPESGHIVEEVYQEGSQMYLMYFLHGDKVFLRLSFTHVSGLLALSHKDTLV